MGRAVLERRRSGVRGTNEGVFFVLSAVTGQPLWHIQTGAVVNANPMAFAIDGRQHVAIASGTTLQVFALPEPYETFDRPGVSQSYATDSRSPPRLPRVWQPYSLRSPAPA